MRRFRMKIFSIGRLKTAAIANPCPIFHGIACIDIGGPHGFLSFPNPFTIDPFCTVRFFVPSCRARTSNSSFFTVLYRTPAVSSTSYHSVASCTYIPMCPAMLPLSHYAMPFRALCPLMHPADSRC